MTSWNALAKDVPKPDPDGGPANVPDWYVCTKCRQMHTLIEDLMFKVVDRKPGMIHDRTPEDLCSILSPANAIPNKLNCNTATQDSVKNQFYASSL